MSFTSFLLETSLLWDFSSVSTWVSDCTPPELSFVMILIVVFMDGISRHSCIEDGVWFWQLKDWCLRLSSNCLQHALKLFKAKCEVTGVKSGSSKCWDKKKLNWSLKVLLFFSGTTVYPEKTSMTVSLEEMCGKSCHRLGRQGCCYLVRNCVRRLDSVFCLDHVCGVHGWNLKPWSWRGGFPVW